MSRVEFVFPLNVTDELTQASDTQFYVKSVLRIDEKTPDAIVLNTVIGKYRVC